MGPIIYILTIIGLWNVFEKAHIPGWKAIIPIYSTWTKVKMVNRPASFFWCMALPIIALCTITAVWGVTGLIATTTGADVIGSAANSIIPMMVGLFTILAVIVTLPLGIILQNDTAKSFGKGIGTTIGLTFLPFIFTIILGFGDAKFTKIERVKKHS